MAAAARAATTKKAAPKRTTSTRTTRTSPAKKPVKKATRTAQSPAGAEPVTSPSVGTSSAAYEPKHERTGPVLGAYRLSLTALEGVTVGVGGLALGSLGKLGLPKGATNTLRNGHAGAIRGATKASDYVGTKVAKVIGKTVAVGSRAATYVFPE